MYPINGRVSGCPYIYIIMTILNGQNARGLIIIIIIIIITCRLYARVIPRNTRRERPCSIVYTMTTCRKRIDIKKNKIDYDDDDRVALRNAYRLSSG